MAEQRGNIRGDVLSSGDAVTEVAFLYDVVAGAVVVLGSEHG